MTVSITINDADIKRKLSAISDQKIVQAALFVGGQKVKSIMATYPPVSRRKQPFKTEKQRRYVFWALRKGLIVIPYFRGQNPRSERLGSRWTVRSGTNRVIVANNASYAGLVQGDEQTHYHKETGWRTGRDVVTRDRDEIVKEISDAYAIGIKNAWSKA